MNKILIANRGEIAVRIIRACKEMNIKTVAIYSEADKDSLHTRLADEAICIGPALATKSYLNIKNIIEAACITKADSIHPGFGFLSENSEFAKICEESNIKFIGPKSEIIDLLGNKSNAKEMMKQAGVPVIPGSNGSVKGLKDAIQIAKEIGYPVMLKAAAGGGGKGIRVAYNSEEIEKAYNIVKQEAKNAFNDDEIYMEKFIQNPRHVEIQILADEHGNVIHLGERDCTIQRNHQKIIEETPSTAIDEKTRNRIESVWLLCIYQVDSGQKRVRRWETVRRQHRTPLRKKLENRVPRAPKQPPLPAAMSDNPPAPREDTPAPVLSPSQTGRTRP